MTVHPKDLAKNPQLSDNRIGKKLPRSSAGSDWGPNDFTSVNGAEALKKVIQSSCPADPQEYILSVESKDYAIKLLADDPFLLAVELRGSSVKKWVEVALQNLGLPARDFRGAIQAAIKRLKDKNRAQQIEKKSDYKQDETLSLLPIIIGRQPRDVIESAWEAIFKSNNPPKIFQFGSTMAMLKESEDRKKLNVMSQDAISGALFRTATWLRESQKGVCDVPPPTYVARDMACSPHRELPKIRSVARAPFLGRSGSIVKISGYDPNEEIWLDLPAEAQHTELTLNPTTSDVECAKKLLLEDLLIDFPFACKASLANCIAAIILPFIRPYIIGPTPLHLIEAPKAGSGKNLLGEVIARIATGLPPPIFTEGKDEDEWRKRITANLIGLPFITFIDNIRGNLNSSQLSAVLTASVWTDRILGLSAMAELPVDTIWYATGNNVQASDEVARRIILIRLNPAEEKPHERVGFKHPNLVLWVMENRWRLVQAVLTIVQSWCNAGKPEGSRTLGSFEIWGRTISGILEHIGIGEVLDNAKTFYELNDRESSDWSIFVRAWFAKFRSDPVELSKLFELANDEDLLLEVRGDKGDNSPKIRLGRALSRHRDQIIYGYQLQVAGKNSKGRRLYRLASVKGAAEVSDLGTDLGANLSTCNILNEQDNSPPSQSAGVQLSPSISSKINCMPSYDDIVSQPSGIVQDSGTPAISPIIRLLSHVKTAVVRDGLASKTGLNFSFELLSRPDQLQALASAICEAGAVGLDIETTGLDPILDKPRLVQIVLPNGKIAIIDSWQTGGLGPIAEALSNATVIGQNLQFDLAFLFYHFDIRPNQVFDTLIASKILGGGKNLRTKGVHSLRGLYKEYLGLDLEKGLQSSDWGGTLSEEQIKYAAGDVAHLFELQDVLSENLRAKNLENTAILEFEVLPTVVSMWLSGIYVDRNAWHDLIAQRSSDANDLERTLKNELNIKNVNSTKQVLEALQQRGFNATATNARSLLPYAADDLIKNLLHFRKLSAFLKNTGKNILFASNKYPDGRVRGQFDQLGTETGRFTCSSPNLLGIPKHVNVIQVGSLLVLLGIWSPTNRSSLQPNYSIYFPVGIGLSDRQIMTF